MEGDEELLVLILRYLQSLPSCAATAATLQTELERPGVLGSRVLWTGEVQPCSLAAFSLRHPQLRSQAPMLRQLARAGARAAAGSTSSLLSRSVVAALRQGSASAAWPSGPMDALASVRIVQPVGAHAAAWPHLAWRRVRPLAETSGHRWMAAYCLKIDRSGRALVSGADDALVKVWSATSGRLQLTLRGLNAVVNDVAVSPDSSMVAACSSTVQGEAAVVRVWGLQDGSPVAVLGGHTHTVAALQVSPAVAEQWWLSWRRAASLFPHHPPRIAYAGVLP
jgi:hypothetical protein